MPFLLSPAGSPQALAAAVEAGADEVYLGGSAFNARMNAVNFPPEALVAAGALCRAKNVRLHVTFNTLLFDREFASAREYLRFLESEVRPDALIVQDMGLVSVIRGEFPSLALHASTQMRIHSPGDIPFLKSLGFTRAVLARELPFGDIKQCSALGLETEIFAHGALCVCESGGCLMSSVIGGRSGNRGECAQPCRLPYNGKNQYPLSLKDLCLAGNMVDIFDSGVTSVKIEGRMKSPDYVYAVTSVYRRLIDEKRNADASELEYLKNVFSRGGFTNGYFTSHAGKSMFGFRSESDKQLSRTALQAARLPAAPPRLPAAKPVIPPFIPPVRDGSLVLPARGQFGLVLRFDCALPSAGLLSKYADSAVRVDVPLRFAADKRLAPYAAKISAVLPRNVFVSERAEFEKQLESAKKLGVNQLTVTSLWQFGLAEKGFFLHGDYTLNVVNRQSLAMYSNYPLSSVMLSPETEGTFPKGSKCALEYIVYGRTPLMHTRACVIQNLQDCPRAALCGKQPLCRAVLTDRVGARFPVFAGANHVNTIYNSLPAWRLDRAKDLKRSGVGLLTLFFTDESDEAASRVIELALRGGRPDFEYTRR